MIKIHQELKVSQISSYIWLCNSAIKGLLNFQVLWVIYISSFDLHVFIVTTWHIFYWQEYIVLTRIFSFTYCNMYIVLNYNCAASNRLKVNYLQLPNEENLKFTIYSILSIFDVPLSILITFVWYTFE